MKTSTKTAPPIILTKQNRVVCLRAETNETGQVTYSHVHACKIEQFDAIRTHRQKEIVQNLFIIATIMRNVFTIAPKMSSM